MITSKVATSRAGYAGFMREPLLALVFVAATVAACGNDDDSSNATPPADAPDAIPGDVADETPPDSGAPPDTITPTPRRCSGPPATAPAPTGPLAEPVSEHRGIDPFERPAYELLRDAILEDPGVHFLATWDAATGLYVVEAGSGDGYRRLEFERVAAPGGGVSYPIVTGSVADIFPETDPALYPDYTSLLAAYENPSGFDHPASNYPAGDPRVGVLPESGQSYPLPLVRLASLFDAPDAPDAVASALPWAYPATSTHGAMGLLQSRATLIVSGRGARQGVVLDTTPTLPDVVPTVLAALGAPTTAGMGPDGAYEDGLYLLRQDGRVLWEALAEDPCDRAKHAIVILFDGLMATEINHLALDPDPDVDVALPTFRSLAQSGAVFRYGAVTGFPSVSAPGHMTAGCGLWQGHHGIVANAFFKRESQSILNPFSLLTKIDELFDDPTAAYALYESAVAEGTETLAQATHRAFGDFDPERHRKGEDAGAFVAVFNELAIGGADYTTLDYFTTGPWLPTASVETYKVADGLAVLQVQELLESDAPVPTVLQLALVATDAAGEQDGPHSDTVREVLVGADAQVAAILEAYAQRGALEDTLIVLVSDHGMELQDPTRTFSAQARLAASGIKVVQPYPGVLYLRTMRVTATRAGSTITVVVRNNDNDAPLSEVTVSCPACAGPATTDTEGTATLTLDDPGADTTVAAEHPEFNPQALPLPAPTP